MFPAPLSEESPQRAEGDGFDTPNALLEAYINALVDADYNALLQTFVIETYVDSIDFEAYLNHYDIFQPWEPIYIDNPQENALNVELRRSYAASSVSEQYEDIAEYGFWEHAVTIKDIVQSNTLPSLSDTIYLAQQRRYENELRKCHGADELTSYAAILDINGEKYTFAPDIARYGDKWYIFDLDGITAEIFGIISATHKYIGD